jgi:SnoaL-like domain
LLADRFMNAAKSADAEGLAAALAPDVVFRSPVVFKPYHGRAEVGAVLAAVVQVFEDFEYVQHLEGGDAATLIFRARVGDREVEGLDYLRFSEDGLVSELTVMVRPMSGMHALAERMRALLEAAA